MERITLREAAARTSRSITTLRRYIRSNRLRAEKRHGRFGPEYFVSIADLAEAGLAAEPRDPSAALIRRADTQAAQVALPAAPVDHDTVSFALYQDLQMKHEQLLVQYGMVRAGGLRSMELQAELETQRRELENTRIDLEQRLQRETSRLRKQLRESRLELEGRALEIGALREKIKALEMLGRNSTTNQTIERQYYRVMAQSRRVDQLSSTTRPGGVAGSSDHRERKRDH